MAVLFFFGVAITAAVFAVLTLSIAELWEESSIERALGMK